VFWKPKLIEFPNNARRLDKLNLAMEKVDEFLETSSICKRMEGRDDNCI
jgi:hypothetical protein